MGLGATARAFLVTRNYSVFLHNQIPVIVEEKCSKWDTLLMNRGHMSSILICLPTAAAMAVLAVDARMELEGAISHHDPTLR